MEVITFEQLGRVAPITAIVLTIIGLTVVVIMRIVKSHIESLKGFIKYLQDEIDKVKK